MHNDRPVGLHEPVAPLVFGKVYAYLCSYVGHRGITWLGIEVTEMVRMRKDQHAFFEEKILADPTGRCLHGMLTSACHCSPSYGVGATRGGVWD